MAFSPAKLWRNTAAAILAIAAFLIAAPAFADKPASVLPGVERLAITAIPIDFDRDDPDRKQFGKLVWRGGINLYAKSPFFGGYSALIIGPSGKSLLAISDAGTWLRANIDYDGRKLKGLSGASIGPILGRDGKPLAGDTQQDFGRLGAHRRRHVEGHGLRRLRAQPSRPALSFHLRPLRAA